MNSPIHILGAGSIGLLLAARLAAVAEIHLVRRPGDWPAKLNLRLREDGVVRTVRLAQAAPAGLTAPIRRLIVCTKAYDALAAVRGLSSLLAPDAALLLMQNGMGSQEEVAAAFPGLSVYAASSTEGAYRPAADEVVHAGRGVTRIGRLQGAEHDWVGLLQRAGFAAEAAEPIAWHLANKLRVNALINPLTVLFRCRNGELLERPRSLRLMKRLGAEADLVLAAAGYVFPDGAFEQAAAVAQRTAANYSSMYQDAAAGRRLELDYITGYLLRLAQRCGVAATAHRAVHARLARVA